MCHFFCRYSMSSPEPDQPMLCFAKRCLKRYNISEGHCTGHWLPFLSNVLVIVSLKVSSQTQKKQNNKNHFKMFWKRYLKLTFSVSFNIALTFLFPKVRNILISFRTRHRHGKVVATYTPVRNVCLFFLI